MIKDSEDFISSYLRKRPAARNAQLARIELVHHKVATNSAEPAALLSACKSYFEQNGRKQHCFSDLRKYISGLDGSLQSEFQLFTSEGISVDNSATVRAYQFFFLYTLADVHVLRRLKTPRLLSLL